MRGVGKEKRQAQALARSAAAVFELLAAATGAGIVASHATHGITGGCQLLVAVVVVVLAFRAMHMF